MEKKKIKCFILNKKYNKVKRVFRKIASSKTWKYKDAGSIYNNFNGIYCIERDNEIVLRTGFKPVKRKCGFIEIVKELE